MDSRTTLQRVPLVARPDVTRVASLGTRASSGGTTLFSTLNPIVQQFLRDPLGNIVAAVTEPIKDLGTAIFALTPEELADTGFQTRLRARGINPETLRPTATANEKAAATGRSLVNVASIVVGGGATVPARAIATRVGLTGMKRAAAIGMADAITGGATAGILTEPPEGMNRGEQALTYAALAAPFGALGGAMSYGLATALRARGIRPELDAPEVVPQRPDGAVEVPRPDEAVARLLGRVDEAVADAPPPPPPPDPIPGDPTNAMQTVLRGVSVGETPTMGGLRSFIANPVESTRQMLRTFYTKAVDDLAPLDRATEALVTAGRIEPTASGARLAGIEDPYVLARLAKSAPDKAIKVLEKGPIDFRTLEPTGTPGIKTILETADQLPAMAVPDGSTVSGANQLRALLLARRAVELDARGKPPGPIPVDAARQVIATATPELKALADQTVQFQTDVLTYLRDAGAISTSTLDAIQALNKEYVPFSRFLEGEPTTGAGVKRGKLASVTAPIQRIKGGAEELQIIDPFESIVRNTMMLTQAADNAAVGRALADLAAKVGDNLVIQRTAPPMRGMAVSFEDVARGFDEIGEPDLAQTVLNLADDVKDELATIFRPSSSLPKGTFFVNGPEGKQYYRVAPDVWDAIMGQKEMMPELFSPMGLSVGAANLARTGTTATPAFWLRNASRDAVNNALVSRYGMLPVVDMVQGVFQTLKRPDLVDAFKRSGSGFATFTRMNERATAQRALHRVLGDPGNQYMGNARALVEGLKSISEKGEEAMRLREFTRALEATGDRRLAALASRDLLDFNRAGQAMRIGNQLIPFLNPQIQGLDKIIRTARTNPAGFFAKNLAYLTAPSLALYALNRNDPSYEELPSWKKDLFWNIPVGGTEGNTKFVSIPVPFELGLVFKSGAERMARWIDTQDPAAWDGFGKNLAASFTLPIVPAIGRGAMTVFANKDLLSGRDVIPRAEQDLVPEMQARPDQGNVTRFLAKTFGLSPRMLEAIVRAHAGGIGTDVLMALDQAEQAIAEVVAGRPESPDIRGVKGVPVFGPVLRGFLTDEPTINSASVEKFYESYEDVRTFSNSLRRSVKDLNVEQRNGLAEQYAPDIGWEPYFRKAAEKMNVARQYINFVRRDPSLSVEQKQEQILQYGRIIRQLAATINSAYGEFNKRRYAQELDPLSSVNAGSAPMIQFRDATPAGRPAPQTPPPGNPADSLNAQSAGVQYRQP